MPTHEIENQRRTFINDPSTDEFNENRNTFVRSFSKRTSMESEPTRYFTWRARETRRSEYLLVLEKNAILLTYGLNSFASVSGRDVTYNRYSKPNFRKRKQRRKSYFIKPIRPRIVRGRLVVVILIPVLRS